MSIWPEELSLMGNDPTITPASTCSLGYASVSSYPANGTGAWPTANKAFYMPFRLAKPRIAMKLGMPVEGETTPANFDIGIYDEGGIRIVSAGSTAVQSFNLNSVDIADTHIGPGLFYLAVTFDQTDTNVWRLTITPTGEGAWWGPMWGIASQTSALPLPATATFAAEAGDYYPYPSVSFRTLY